MSCYNQEIDVILNHLNFDLDDLKDMDNKLQVANMLVSYLGVAPPSALAELESYIVIKRDNVSVDYKKYEEKWYNEGVETNNNSKNTEHVNNGIEIADEILKLHNLKEQGILTEEEFTSQKKKLLGL